MAFLTGMAAGGYWALQSSRVQTYLTRMITRQIAEKTNAEIRIGRVDIALFREILLEDVLLEDQQADTLFFSKSIALQLDSIQFKKRRLVAGALRFHQNRLKIKKDTANHFNFSFLIDSLATPREKPGEWQFLCHRFDFSGSTLLFEDASSGKPKNYTVHDLAFNVADLSYIQDTLTFEINQLTLNDGKNFEVKNFHSVVRSDAGKLEFTQMDLETNRSRISDSEFRMEFPEKEAEFPGKTQLDFRLSNASISLIDLAGFIPAIRGMNQVFYCSGRIYGTVNDLKGRDLHFSTGKNTSGVLDFYANDISSPENMYLFLDLKRSQTTFSDLSSIRLPSRQGGSYLRFPEAFYDSGVLTYEGNFTGFLNDFVAFGTLTSEMGNITTDLSVVPEKKGRIAYRGEVDTEDFRLGELLQLTSVGEITFDGSVDGYLDSQNQAIAGAFDGEIVQISINNYQYENIQLDGFLHNKMFDGLINMDDPNLQFDFLGKVNLNPEVPDFDFKLDLKKALPGKLNLSKRFSSSELSFSMTADFSGDKIDNLAGSIAIDDGLYKNRNGAINLEGMELKSITTGDANYLSFTSDFFDVRINGEYQFQNIFNAFEMSIDRYIPALREDKMAGVLENKFGYQIDAKNLDSLMAVFTPGYRLETPFLLYGRLDSEQSVFEMKGNIPGFSTKNLIIKNISIANTPGERTYDSKIRLGEVRMKNGMKLQNLTVNSVISENVINNQIAWGETGDSAYRGQVQTRASFSKVENQTAPHITVEGIPSTVYIADSLWQISSFGASIDSTAIEIHNFAFSSGRQEISLEGKIAENKSDSLTLDFRDIRLGNWQTYLNKNLPLGGLLNGSVKMQDFYGERRLFSNLTMDDFRFKQQDIGHVAFRNQWDNTASVLNSELTVTRNGRQSLYASGFYEPGENRMLYTARLDNFSLVVLETVIRKTFSNFHGDASGEVKIHGNPDKILIDGTLRGVNAGMTIDYTQVSYYFTDRVIFRGDTILFDQITFQDVTGNKGTFNGTIVHTNFQDMIYDLSASSSQIVAINTTLRDNQQFFGRVVAGGRVNITGRGQQVNLTGSGTTLSGTSVNISLEDESEIERYDFIRFASAGDDQKEAITFAENEENSDFSLNLTIRATPEARAQLIYNAQIGDVIKARGEGILNFGMDKEGNITLSGNYTVDQGEYLFTLQNVINKRFTIEEGGTLDWSGDPYNAIIDLNAVYKLKASLYDLLVNSYENIYQNQRIPVECKILLTENLSNPEIDFKIDFPTVEDRLIDELQQFFSTPEDMNKQILSLIVLGKFYTPEYLRGTYEAQNPNLIGTTASELFSNQLSNWLSQISNNVDIGLNYRPGNQITDDEIELALSTQMFNDRVIINGNIGNNNNPNSANNSQLVGDFEVNVKLIQSGKIQLKAYNRSNNNLIYETAPYTQGVGLSIQEDYNNFNDLLRKMKAFFSGKKTPAY